MTEKTQPFLLCKHKNMQQWQVSIHWFNGVEVVPVGSALVLYVPILARVTKNHLSYRGNGAAAVKTVRWFLRKIKSRITLWPNSPVSQDVTKKIESKDF